MRILLTTLIILLSSLTGSFAQIATPTTTSFEIGGIKVIFKPSKKQVINVRMYYRGGITNYPVAKAGLENFALTGAINCGTQQYSANALKDSCDKYGVFINADSSYDYGYIQLNCISKYFNKGWDMFADVINAPLYEANEVKLLREKIISNTKTVAAGPIVAITKPLALDAFKGTVYGADPYGTEETLNAITPADLKSYYSSLLNKQKMFLVVVGNITKDELIEKILFAFGNIPSKSYRKPEYETPAWNDNKILTLQRNTPVDYVVALTNSPDVKSVDYIPFKLAMFALGSTIGYNLTTQLKIAYNPTTNCVPTLMPYTHIGFATTNPQQAITEVFKTIKLVQKNGVNDDWLMRLKNGLVIGNFINEQNAAAVTDRLGLAEINSGWQYADDFPQLIYLSTTEQVKAALNKYITGLKWGYLGNPDHIANFTLPLF
jgi:zinc protease